MRLFVGIPLSGSVMREFARLQDNLPKAMLAKTSDFHLTFQFLGEVSDDRVDELENRLKKIKHNPIICQLDKLGVFPGEYYFNVVWCGVKPKDEIVNLANLIREELSDFKADKAFHPHITLARIKLVTNKIEFLSDLKKTEVKKINLTLNAFCLIKSILTSHGPIHTPLRHFSLR